jgi:hypothetical protein
LDEALDSWKGRSATERAMASYLAEDRADFQARHNTGLNSASLRRRVPYGFGDASGEPTQLSPLSRLFGNRRRRRSRSNCLAARVDPRDGIRGAPGRDPPACRVRAAPTLDAVPLWLDLMIAGLVIIGLLAFAGWLFGARRTAQFTEVASRVQAGATDVDPGRRA